MYLVKTKKCLEYRLRREIRRGRLLDVSNVERAIGKTTLLIKLAKEYDAVIVCTTMSRASNLQKIYPDTRFMGMSLLLTSRGEGLIYHPRLKVLLEEGLTNKRTIKRLLSSSTEVIGGYSHYSGYKPEHRVIMNQNWCRSLNSCTAKFW